MTSKYFKETEFQGWYDLLDKNLLPMLDAFREKWGKPVRISPAPGAVGRRASKTEKSLHNVNLWGKVRAVDILPTGMKTKEDFKKAFDIAKEVGFTGIGVYPDWVPQPGLHVDNRPGIAKGNPAKWSAFRINGQQVYFPVDKAFG